MATCRACSQPVAATAHACPNCGADLQPLASAEASASARNPLPYVHPEETSAKAVGSLICGLLSILFLPAIAAVVLGHMALADIKRNAGRVGGRGMAIAGLVLGYLALVAAPILIILTVAIPNLRASKMRAQETAALASTNAITAACVGYFSSHGTFPHTLADLGAAANGANLLDSTLAPASGNIIEKNGYVFRYTPGAADASGIINSYIVTADPVAQNTTGVRRFFTNQTGVVRSTADGTAASGSSPPLK
jgi:type II secretory pathway pseudopilin PulG